MKLFSPAKINLFLAVKGKKEDGYHEIVTLLCCIDLCDNIILDFPQEGITCKCDAVDVPNGKTNIAYQAASLFLSNLEKEKGISPNGVTISIEKKIPVGAGLGGGSSNAATVLLGLNEHYGNIFPLSSLMEMGLSIGADVPFFLFKKPAFATGIGEKLSLFKGLKQYKVVLVYPNQSISTKAVYKNLNLGLTKCKQKLNCLLFKKKTFIVPDHLCNDLEPVTGFMCPDINLIKQKFLNEGAKGSLMSGSGSSVFGLFSEKNKADRAYHRLSENKNWRVFLTDMIV